MQTSRTLPTAPQPAHRNDQPALSRPRPLAGGEVLLAMWEGQMAAVAAVRGGLARASRRPPRRRWRGCPRRPAGLCRRRHLGAHRRAGRRRAAADLRLARGPAGAADGRRRGGFHPLDRECRGRSRRRASATSPPMPSAPNDVVIGIAASGATPYTTTVVAESRGARGAHHRHRQQPRRRAAGRGGAFRSWSRPAPKRSPVRHG